MATEQLHSISTPDGVTLRYVDAGSGAPPILFIHGWTCNIGTFRDQIPFFTKNHRVVAYDQRGHGESDKPDQDYNIEGFVNDAVWFINELRLEKSVLVGHSMGGTIVLNLVQKHPELASAAVLIDSPILLLDDAGKALVNPLLAGLESPAYAGVVEGFGRMGFFNKNSPPELVEELIAVIKSAPQRLMFTALKSTLDDANKPAGPLPVPSLFIRAEEPQMAPVEGLRERYPGMSVVTVPGTAHFVQMEQPAATNNIIKDFLDKLE
jgi:pimeloyl-ACP methyl ester carboxylesterase